MLRQMGYNSVINWYISVPLFSRLISRLRSLRVIVMDFDEIETDRRSCIADLWQK